MKYYIHKKTNEPLAVMSSLVDYCGHNNSGNYPHVGERKGCLKLCIFPERWIGNGISIQAIHCLELGNFKRISKQNFHLICPDFGQFMHKNNTRGKNPFLIDLITELTEITTRKEKFGN